MLGRAFHLACGQRSRGEEEEEGRVIAGTALPEIQCCWTLVLCWGGFLGASRLIPCHLLESPCPSSSLWPLEPVLAPLPFNVGYFPIFITNYFPAFALRTALSPEILMFYFPFKTSSFSVCHHNLASFCHP